MVVVTDHQRADKTPGTAFPLTTVTKLTDAFMVGFGALHREELTRREVAKVRLRGVLQQLNLFAAEPSREDYTPDGGA